MIGEQPPDFIAGQSTPLARARRNRNTETVGVGIVGDRD
jgi:hypothetical protein